MMYNELLTNLNAARLISKITTDCSQDKVDITTKEAVEQLLELIDPRSDTECIYEWQEYQKHGKTMRYVNLYLTVDGVTWTIYHKWAEKN